MGAVPEDCVCLTGTGCQLGAGACYAGMHSSSRSCTFLIVKEEEIEVVYRSLVGGQCGSVIRLGNQCAAVKGQDKSVAFRQDGFWLKTVAGSKDSCD